MGVLASIGTAFAASLTTLGLLALFAAADASADVERDRLARHYDKNSTRQILKQNNLPLYLEKKAEFTSIAERFRKLALLEQADDVVVAELIAQLRASPFYDAQIHQPELHNLFNAVMVSGNTVPATYLDPRSRCLADKPHDKYLCTKQELLRDMYHALGLEGETCQ